MKIKNKLIERTVIFAVEKPEVFEKLAKTLHVLGFLDVSYDEIEDFLKLTNKAEVKKKVHFLKTASKETLNKYWKNIKEEVE